MHVRALLLLFLVLAPAIVFAETPDPKAAALDAGCAKGKAEDCAALGAAYTSGTGVETDLAKAFAALTKACDGGSLYGCNLLSIAYQNGKGVKADLKKAAALSEQGCNATAGDRQQRGVACGRLGYAYDTGKGVKKDIKRANALFEKGCDLGGPFGCSVLGAAYLYGEGVKKDVAKGKALLDKACKGGLADACKRLAAANKPGPSGGGGTCPGTGEIRCGGVCVNTLAPTSRNCGGCGNVCPGGFYCNSGSCSAR